MRIIALAVLIAVIALLRPPAEFSDRAATMMRDLGQDLTRLTGPHAPVSAPGKATTSAFRDSDVNVRAEPSTTSDVVGVGGVEERVQVDRPVTGETVTCQDGHSTAEWLHIGNGRITGFVSRCYL